MAVIKRTVLMLVTAMLLPVHSAAYAEAASEQRYSYAQSSRDGIGQICQRREISHVMGHRGAVWLERSSRVREELPDKAVAAMDLKPISLHTNS